MGRFCRKGDLARSGKRWLALLMSLCLIGTMIPVTVKAENGSTDTGLCEHHTEHTAECGYVAPVEGHECGHVHDESCGYQQASECTHVHDESCGENAESCTHEHDDVCGYAEGHECGHVHDDKCGYVESSEGSPCTFVCDICGNEAEPEGNNLSAAVPAVQVMIGNLPDAEDITEENFDEVSDLLGEIDTAKEALTAEESASLDYTKYDAAVSKMMELMGQSGAGEPVLMPFSGFSMGFSMEGKPAGTTVRTINLNAAVLRPSSTWSTGGNLVYFGSYNNSPVAYRVLSSPNTQESSSNYLLLDCNTILQTMAFSSDNTNQWAGSNCRVRSWLISDFYSNSSVFSSIEQGAIANTVLKDQSRYIVGVYSIEYIDDSTTDNVFCLSAAEVDGLYGADNNGSRAKTGGNNIWWLRSAITINPSIAGLVDSSGRIFRHFVGSDGGVSPALNVNLSSVLFASESGTGKSSALAAVSGGTAAEWKLTLLDSSKTVNVTNGESVTKEGTTVTVPYTYTGSDVSQISVMITDKAYTDSSAQVLYYGALQGVTISNLTGTGTFTLPTELADKTCGTDYYAYIIAEDVNGEKETDYASTPVQITISTSVSKYTVTVTNGTLSGGSTTGDYAQGETVTITADAAPGGQQFKEWTVESGNITLADSTSATTTFTMPAEAVSVKANYEKIITSVEVNISQPTPGNNLAGTAAVSTPGVKTASPDITWKEGSKTAGPTAGYHTAYTAEVTLSPDTDYVFASQVTANIKVDGTTVGSGTVTNNASGTITISYTFAATRKANVIRIINPAAITGVANGTAKTAAALGLPGTVMMVTEDGNRMADVTWDLSNLTGTYEPSVLTEQTFTADGKVTLPSDLGNGRNITLNASVQVTVSEAGVVGAVQATPTEGTYSSNQKIVLRSSTDGAEIYYTIDGSEPGRTNGTKYTEAIDVTGREGQSVQTRIKAIAVKSGMKDSGAVTFTYTIQIPVPKYTVTVTGGSATGEYAQGETVTITAGAAPEGQQFKEWVVESGNITLADSTGETTSFTMPAGEVKVRAVYEEGRNPGGGAADPGTGGAANPGAGGAADPNTPGRPDTPDTTYQIINGANSSWIYGSDEGLTIRGNGEFSRFTGVRVDGRLLDQSNYTAREGSTIITLKTSYLNTLEAGTHTVEILWADGSASTIFIINASAFDKKDDVPKTGDSMPLIWLFVLAGLSGTGLIITAKKGGKNLETLRKQLKNDTRK